MQALHEEVSSPVLGLLAHSLPRTPRHWSRKATAATKDVSGWREPAAVTDIASIKDAQIGLRWRGRLMLHRRQDVRRALTYVCFMMMPRTETPITILEQAAERHLGVVVRLGWLKNKDRWFEFEANRRYATRGLGFKVLSLGV